MFVKIELIKVRAERDAAAKVCEDDPELGDVLETFDRIVEEKEKVFHDLKARLQVHVSGVER
jgi:hypothetical protein